MRDPVRRAISQAKVWLRKCEYLGVLDDVMADIHKTDIRKENKKGKETFPPAPPIEKREVQEKDDDDDVTRVRAGAHEDGPPTLSEFLAWCPTAGITDSDWARRRYAFVQAGNWQDETCQPITHWQKYFLAAFEKLSGNRRKARRGAYQTLAGDVKTMFDAFWAAYPTRRRTEKDKCAEIFARIMRNGNDAVALFNAIMDGLAKWSASHDWRKQGGEYVMTPYRWLFNANWENTPERGCGVERRQQVSATANVQLGEKLW